MFGFQVCHDFVLLQVILCTKEVNEKTRMLALRLLIKFGYLVQRSQEKKADGNNRLTAVLLCYFTSICRVC